MSVSPQARQEAARRRLAKWLFIGVGVAFCVLVATLVLKPGADARAARTALLRVEKVPMPGVLHEIGTVEALNEITLLTRFTGDIVWKEEDGKVVEAGDPVVRFEGKLVQEDIDVREAAVLDKRDAVRQATDDIATLKKRYEHVIRQAEIQYELAVLGRKVIYDAPTPEDKQDAELALQGADLDRKRAQVDLDSYTELATQGFATEANVKLMRLALATAKVNHAKAKVIYDLTLQGNTPDAKRVADLAVADARKSLNIARFNREADLAVSQANLELAQVDLANAERELARKRQDLEWTTVRAPVRGHVVFTEVYKGSSKSKSRIEVGESRSAGGDLGVICDTSALKVRLWINESDVKDLAAGQRATVLMPAFPGRRFQAEVSELAVLATDKNVALSSLALRRAGEAFVNVVQAKLTFTDLAEADRKEIRVGFNAEVFIQTSGATEALAVPWSAVRYERDGTPFAEVAAGSRRERRTLKLGRGDTLRVEVFEGLKENEQVYDLTGATYPGTIGPAETRPVLPPVCGGS
ncbi:MAG: efflux RND transporter periplasmic adaptor subunit [Planctomycetota bacterium]|nr:efflux RND transporter periplasmic adaptor subunit [Planctomycetota bacterium]